MHHVFGPSCKILSDNGTEFSNKLFETVAKEIGVEHKIYSPPYRPQSNGRIEGFHSFLKTCLAKHVSPNVEWDEVCTLATAAYNFLPNEHSRESPFFIMFGRFDSTIGYRHSRLSSFGTSNFFKKMCVPARGYFYSLSSQLQSPLARAVALFVLHLLHSTGYWYLCFIDQLRVNF